MKRKSISSDPEVMGGIPCFSGTRVPVQTLLDYLEAGATAGLGNHQEGTAVAARGSRVRCVHHGGSKPLVQQNLPRFEIAVVVLRAKSYRLEDLKPLVPRLPTRWPSTYAWQPGSGEMAIVAGRGPGFR